MCPSPLWGWIFMALAQPKDLSLSPKSNSSSILPALSAPARFSTFFFSFFPYGPASLSIFFLAGPCYVCLTPPNFFHLFFFFPFLQNDCEREPHLFDGKKKKSNPPKRKTTRGAAGTEIALEPLRPFSFFFFYFSFFQIYYSPKKISVFLYFSFQGIEMSCCFGRRAF